jgi:hypothetical protein
MYCPHVQARVYNAGVVGGEGMGDRRSPLRATRRQIRLREPADKPESMAKALRALGPAHPATCPRGCAAPSPGRGQGGPTSAYTPATPARGCAARVAGPECTDVLEDRKRRPDAASGPDRRPSSPRWEGRRLSSGGGRCSFRNSHNWAARDPREWQRERSTPGRRSLAWHRPAGGWRRR